MIQSTGDRPAFTESYGLGALSVFRPSMRNFELALRLGRPIQSRRLSSGDCSPVNGHRTLITSAEIQEQRTNKPTPR